MKIVSLSTMVDDPDDKKLCPVRALRFYLERTKRYRNATSRRLFVSTIAPYSGVTTTTLSKWIKEAVKLSYAQDASDDRQHAQIRAHDLRGMATTLAFNNNATLTEVMRAASWKRHTTFSDFYLKDLTSINDGLRSLGTLSVARRVI
jgi:hypothetical protein